MSNQSCRIKILCKKAAKNENKEGTEEWLRNAQTLCVSLSIK
jgi:hypothetical protein